MMEREEKEWVLLVPPKLAQSSYATLVSCGCVARPWHLAGRFGSRTHRVDKDSVGIPILSKVILMKKALLDKELQDLLDTPGVKTIYKPYHDSSRCHDPPPLDATIHPERAPKPTHTTALVDSHRPSDPAFTYAELFAGIGGFGVALQALGGKCIFCSELEEHLRHVYAQNFPSTTNLQGDIYEVHDKDLPKQLDLLVAGFPCQPFSALGEQPGLQCPKGHLFLEITRVLNHSKPKAFLLENVPGLVKMTETLDVILSALEGAGYDVKIEVCNARGLTATSRSRLYIVGLQRQDEEQQAPFEFPYVPDLRLRARDVIDFDDKHDDILRINDSQLERLIREKFWKPAHLAWPNVVCNTLVSHYGNAIAKGTSQLVPCATGNPRRFSPRECARLMGFPGSFLLPAQRENQGEMAHLKEQYRMFGNAVCPPVIAAIAGAILERCPGIKGYNDRLDWVEWGRTTAVHIAGSAAPCRV